MSQLWVMSFEELDLGRRNVIDDTLIKSRAGHQKLFFGRKKEDAKTGVVCSLWSSAEAAISYKAASPLGSEAATERALIYQSETDPLVALRAPCTEVFTAFGAEEGFWGQCKRFIDAVERERETVKGYFGGVATWGEHEGEKTARALLGWESKDAHVEAKGVEGGVIMRNIHELRSLRRSVDLFHVEFKEL